MKNFLFESFRHFGIATKELWTCDFLYFRQDFIEPHIFDFSTGFKLNKYLGTFDLLVTG